MTSSIVPASCSCLPERAKSICHCWFCTSSVVGARYSVPYPAGSLSPVELESHLIVIFSIVMPSSVTGSCVGGVLVPRSAAPLVRSLVAAESELTERSPDFGDAVTSFKGWSVRSSNSRLPSTSSPMASGSSESDSGSSATDSVSSTDETASSATRPLSSGSCPSGSSTMEPSCASPAMSSIDEKMPSGTLAVFSRDIV